MRINEDHALGMRTICRFRCVNACFVSESFEVYLHFILESGVVTCRFEDSRRAQSMFFFWHQTLVTASLLLRSALSPESIMPSFGECLSVEWVSSSFAKAAFQDQAYGWGLAFPVFYSALILECFLADFTKSCNPMKSSMVKDLVLIIINSSLYDFAT